MSDSGSIMKVIVAVATAAALSLSGWTMISTVGHEARIGRSEERADNMRDRLDRIENKIDWLISERVRESRESASSSRGTPTRRHPRQSP